MILKEKNEDFHVNLWGIKPIKTSIETDGISIIGNEITSKMMFLKKIVNQARKQGFLVSLCSDNGILSSKQLYDSLGLTSKQLYDSLSVSSGIEKVLIIVDDSLTNKDINKLKSRMEHIESRFVYYDVDSEKDNVVNKFSKNIKTTVEFIGKSKVVVSKGEAKQEIRTINLGNWSSKKLAITILVLIVGFFIGGAYQLRTTSLIGAGNYSLSSNDVMDSGVLYSTPDGVAIGIMNSIKSEAKPEEITKAVKNIQSQPNVGVLAIQSGYYKTSKGLEAIVDFGLTAKSKVDEAVKSNKIKDTAWKSYVNRNVSYVVLNTKAYDSPDKAKKDEEASKKALESNDLTVLSDNANVSAVSNVSTTSSQFTQLPLYSDTDSMEKIKKAKTGSIVEINVGDFKLFFKMVSDDMAKKEDEAYKEYLTRLACVQVGNELASQVDENSKIDAESRIAIEENVKQALMQYASKG